MKHFVPLSLLLLVSLLSSAQITHSIDSLLAQLKTEPRQKERIALLNEVALQYYNQDLKKSLEYGQQAYNLAENLGDEEGLERAITMMMRVHRRLANFSVAIELNLKKIRLSEKLKDTVELVDAYSSLGNMYSSLENYEEAKKNLIKAYHIGLPLDAEKLSSIMNFLGSTYGKMGKYDSAFFWINKAFDREQKKPQPDYTLSYIYNNLAEIFFYTKNYKKSLENYETAYHLPENKKSNYGLTFTLIGKARIFNALKKYEEAISTLKESLALSMKYGYREKTREAYGLLHEIDEQTGDFKNALAHYKLFNLYQDSILSEDRFQYIENLKINFETERISNENQLLKKDAELKDANLRQQWYLVVASIIIVFLMSLALILLSQKNRQKRKSNQLLSQYNQSLTQQVEERTKDLVKSNLELIQQNNQLEQFGYITAHNLRAPVARVLGLTNLINHDGFSMPRDKEILEKLEFNAKDLDTVIRDLNDILQIRKGLHSTFQMIDLKERLEKTKRILKDKINESGIVITETFDGETSFFSVPAYIESILYNLISNAIKYRSPEREPKLDIRSTRTESHLSLSIEDNGIGIDLNRQRDKVFSLYQRFHQHVEGKGLGLFLVKTQVETLNGKIEIESEVNKGTRFHIEFPLTAQTA